MLIIDQWRSTITPVGVTQCISPGGSALEYVKRGRRDRPRAYVADVRFETSLDVVREATGGWGELTQEGTAVRWRLGVDTLEWPVMLLAAVDADFTVLGPPELAERVRAAGDRLTRCTTPG